MQSRAAPEVKPPARPMLKPALQRVWRGATSLQLGIDPERALLIDGVGPAERHVLALLDGTHERDELIQSPRAARLLDLLARGGALDDGTEPSPLQHLDRAERDRLAPDQAAHSLANPGPGAAARAWRARGSAVVEVHGAGRVGAAVANLLAAAGVGELVIGDEGVVHPQDLAPGGYLVEDVGSPRASALLRRAGQAAPSLRQTRSGRAPDLAVVCPTGRVDETLAHELAHGKLPHVLAMAHEAFASVGPFVIPGRTPCLHCLDLHRTDRDPGWPLVVVQLSEPRRTGQVACDTGLALAAASLAARAALAFIDDQHTPSAFAGLLLELRLPDGLPRRRSFGAHPACGCQWPGQTR